MNKQFHLVKKKHFPMKLGIPENACQEQFNQSFLVDIKEKKLILALVLKKKKKKTKELQILAP